jgi:hypothetical protein
MKRQAAYTPKYPQEIRRIWPLLSWCLCDRCRQEFRFEGGWEIAYDRDTRSVFYYLCQSCAPTLAGADGYALTRNSNPAPPGDE